MGRKDKGPSVDRMLKDEIRREENPFASIVLREKKEEKKKETVLPRKKPGEIVSGYVPSASFGDILSNFEKTGQPYAMPKARAKKESSFGDILSLWENGSKDTSSTKGKPKSKTVTQNNSSYKATKSFADILSQYEEGVRKEKSREEVKTKEKAVGKGAPMVRGTTLFYEETEDDRIAPGAVWSVMGGKNENYVPPEKEVKKEEKKDAYVRKSAKYTPSSSFGDILSSYEKGKAVKAGQGNGTPDVSEKKNSAKPDTLPPEPDFFLHEETEGVSVPSNVSWSILGGANVNYVRKEEDKAEETAAAVSEKEEEKKDAYVRRSAKYTPTASFSEILSSYGRKKAEESIIGKETKESEKEEIAPGRVVLFDKEDVTLPPEPDFFISPEGMESVPSHVSWSIIGGANTDYVKPVEEAAEPPVMDEEIKAEESVPSPTEDNGRERNEKEHREERSSYVPSRSFSEILSSFEASRAKKKGEETVKEAEAPMEEKEDRNPFFMEESEEEKVPAHVSWSILGGANSSYVRKEERKAEERQVDEEKAVPRSTAPYEPRKKFSSILRKFEEEKPREKTFEEILREKGDGKEKRARRGVGDLRRMDPQATLDLHGNTQKESEEEIRAFLDDAVRHGLRKVSIITGKGLHSADGQCVLRSLAERIVDESGVASEKSNAPVNKGGSGALWIILKERERE